MKKNHFFYSWALMIALMIIMLMTVMISCSPQLTSSTTPGAASGTLNATQASVAERAPIKTSVSEKDGMGMVFIPAGEFLMGSIENDPNAKRNEQPQHKVFLDAFWIDQTEVTNAMFARFVAETGYKTDAEKEGWATTWTTGTGFQKTKGADWRHPQGPDTSIIDLDNHPVVQMTWNDAQAYCQWAGRQLPTEAQWEKAARGADGRIYPWGNQAATCDYAVMNDIQKGYGCGTSSTWPVGSKPQGASPYGVLDMAGNAYELVADWCDFNYYSGSPSKNPPGPTSGQSRAGRGGCWRNASLSLRTATRDSGPPNIAYVTVGFRCACNKADLQ